MKRGLQNRARHAGIVQRERHSIQQHSVVYFGWEGGWVEEGMGNTSSVPGYLKLLLDLAGAVKQNEAGAARWECPMQEAQAQRTGTLCHAGVHQGASGLPIERESTAGATPLAPLLDCLQVETMLTGKGP